MTDFFPQSIWLSALIIFGLRITDVSLGTVRTIMTVKGRNLVAGAIGFVEVTIFIFAISQVLRGIEHPVQIFAYSGGFATGTVIGGVIEKWLALGYVLINVHGGAETQLIAGELRAEGFGVTQYEAIGKDGPVRVVETLVPRKSFPLALDVIQTVAPHAFVHATEQQFIRRGYVNQLKKK
jgi:uncharacterized protein YebE (UPF0316 family)